MPEFYHDLTTEKSFQILQDLKRRYRFILIGGWAVFLYTKALKSKDIDLIIDYDTLAELRSAGDVFKNERLSKYELKAGEVDIDLYLPHFSKLGFPVEEVQRHTQSLEGFVVPSREVLLILKLFTYRERKGSAKGTKDAMDCVSLLAEGALDGALFQELLARHKLVSLKEELAEIFSSSVSLPELDLSEHKFAKLKKEVLGKLT